MPGQGADESDDEGNRSGTGFQGGLHVLHGHYVELFEYGKMTVELSVGAERNLESANELRGCS